MELKCSENSSEAGKRGALQKEESASLVGRDEKLYIMNYRKKSSRNHWLDEEIQSDQEISVDEKDEISSNDSVDETPEEKRRRLSKKYLKEVEETIQHEPNEENQNWNKISNKLKTDRLLHQGKFMHDLSSEAAGINWATLPKESYSNQQKTITSLELSSNEDFIVTGGKDNSVIIWDTETGQKNFLSHSWNMNCDYFSHEKEILSVSISSDSRYIVSGGREKIISVFDRRVKNAKIHSFEGHRDCVTGLAFQKGSYALFSCSNDRCLKYWDLNEMGYIETMFGHQDSILSVDCSSKLQPLTSSGDRTIRSWKVDQSSHLVFRGHKAPIDVVKTFGDDSFLSASQDGMISLWKTTKKTPVFSVQAHGLEGYLPCWVASLAVLENSNLFFTGSYDGTVKIWSACDENVRQCGLIDVVGYINGISVSSNLVVIGASREPRLGRWISLKSAREKLYVYRLPNLISFDQL